MERPILNVGSIIPQATLGGSVVVGWSTGYMGEGVGIVGWSTGYMGEGVEVGIVGSSTGYTGCVAVGG